MLSGTQVLNVGKYVRVQFELLSNFDKGHAKAFPGGPPDGDVFA